MKKVVLISGILLTFVIGVYFYYYSENEKYVLENRKGEQIINSNSLTMMYETASGSGEYQISNDITWPQEGYVFNETLSKCENGSTITWDDENKKVLLQTNTSDKCYVYFDVSPTLADYIINNVYTDDGINGLYYHDGVGTYTNADQEAGDNSYRYSGANPNNYVCFGSDEEVCSEDNLYRIIGVFSNKVKLIKYTKATSDILGENGGYSSDGKYMWNDVQQANWDLSVLNTINLNNNYLNSLGEKWEILINDFNWNTKNGSVPVIIGSVKALFDAEINNSQYYSSKIGLMYPSDYGYAALSETWNSNMYKLGYNSLNNWLYLGEEEWTIIGNGLSTSTQISELAKLKVEFLAPDPTAGNDQAVLVGNGTWQAYTTFAYAVRPTFYLNSDVTYVSGTGTQEDPYRIA